ncbi:MAG: potassium channel family protein [Ruminococcus sp.]|nr:potassium channel family protein [Ruminococcus sp.]
MVSLKTIGAAGSDRVNAMTLALKNNSHKIYDGAMGALAVINAVLILIDAAKGLGPHERIVYLICYAVFAADLCIRAGRAEDLKKFFRRNYWDLIAVLPIHGIMPGFSPRTELVLRMLNLVRIAALLARPLRKARRFYNTNGFKYVVMASVTTIVTGGVLIHYAEGMELDDGIWWAFVTATTVGYGDISPGTVYGRLIAMFLMLVGIGLIGSLTSTLTSFFLHRGTKSARGSMLETVKEKLEDFDSLSEEDVEDICNMLMAMKTHSCDKGGRKQK